MKKIICFLLIGLFYISSAFAVQVTVKYVPDKKSVVPEYEKQKKEDLRNVLVTRTDTQDTYIPNPNSRSFSVNVQVLNQPFDHQHAPTLSGCQISVRSTNDWYITPFGDSTTNIIKCEGSRPSPSGLVFTITKTP